MQGAAQPAGAPAIHLRNALQEYGFLVGSLVDAATLAAVEAEALACGVRVHQVLLAWGLVSHEAYAAALAHRLGVPLVGWEAGLEAIAVHQGSGATAELWARRQGKRPLRILVATEAPPDALLAQIAGLHGQGIETGLTSQRRAEAAIAQQNEARVTERAVRGLLDERPRSSAASPAATWQLMAAAVCVGLAIGGVAIVPEETHAAVTALVAIPFLCVALLRVVALQQAFAGPARGRRRERQAPPRCPDAQLPFYTVLVPLFEEANVLPGLIRSLAALDYPAAKLDVILVLETVDLKTQAAVLGMNLPGNFRTLVVPDRQPRTKPKALNYALQFARGDFVVVYDAEDRPQRDQLRRAWEVFRRAPPGLGCLQAQLNIYNPWDGWFFTRGIMAQTPPEMNPA